MDRKIEKKKWPPKKIATVAAIGLFCVAATYSIMSGRGGSRLNVDIEKLTISTVTEGEFQEFITVTGTVMPIRTIYLDATEGGRVEKIYLEAGSIVEKGDSILQLTNTNLLLDVMYREAQLFEQSNNLRSTRLAMEQNRLSLQAQLAEQDYQILRQKRVYDRFVQLHEKNLISQQEWEEAKDQYEYLLHLRELTLETQKQDSIFRAAQIEQLEASVERLSQNLDIVRQNQESLILKAPVSGQLTSLNAEIGQSKSRGERIGQVDVLDGFKIRVTVDEHYISRINVGQHGEFDFAGSSYRLTITKVYPEVRNGRFEIDMEFKGEEAEDIRRGQTIHVRLELGDLEQAVLLARGGFYSSTGGHWAYVLDESGDVASKIQIRLGRQNPRVYEVLEGLNAGDRVVTSSYDNFGDVDMLMLNN